MLSGGVDLAVLGVDADPQRQRIVQGRIQSDDQVAFGVDAQQKGRVHARYVAADEMVFRRPRLLRAVSQLASDLVGGPVARIATRHPERIDHQAQPLPVPVLNPGVHRDPHSAARVQDSPAAESDSIEQEPVNVRPAGDVVDAWYATTGDQPDATVRGCAYI